MKKTVFIVGTIFVLISITSGGIFANGCLPGDADDDGQADKQDLEFVLSHYGQSSAECGDQNNDSLVNLFDFGVVLNHLQTAVSPTPTFSPFPPNTSGWRPFSGTSPWNQTVSSQVDPNSDTYINYIIDTCGDDCPIDTATYGWGCSVYFVGHLSPYPPPIDVPAHSNWGNSLYSVPVPSFAVPDSSSDAHMSIIDRNRGWEWGFWQIRGSYPDLTAGNGWKTSLSGSGVLPGGQVACRESGFPCIAGLVRQPEVKSGVINHALAFSFDARNGYDAYVYPASSGADNYGPSGDHVPPMGTRFQLKQEVDISNFSRGAKAVARALKTYGMYLGDENARTDLTIGFQTAGDPDGDGIVESGDELWDGVFTTTDRHDINLLQVSDFQVVLPP